jgi:hypothetical protein
VLEPLLHGATEALQDLFAKLLFAIKIMKEATLGELGLFTELLHGGGRKPFGKHESLGCVEELLFSRGMFPSYAHGKTYRSV